MRSEFTSQIHTSNFEPSPKKRKREDGQNFGNEHSDDPNSSRYDDPSAAFSSRQISTRSRSYIKVDSYIIIKQECEKMLQFTVRSIVVFNYLESFFKSLAPGSGKTLGDTISEVTGSTFVLLYLDVEPYQQRGQAPG